MKLYEFEGHSILKKGGIESPFFITCSNLAEIAQARKRLKFPIVAKVQVLSGKRGKAGAIKVCTTEAQLNLFAKQFLGKDFQGEEVMYITLAEKIEIDHEYYISITYDTTKKIPFLLFCEEGGADIEEVRRGIMSDKRIGSHFLYPGPGYGGSCFPKDVKALVSTSQKMGMSLSIVEAVDKVNQPSRHTSTLHFLRLLI